jgi:hypothetical protein
MVADTFRCQLSLCVIQGGFFMMNSERSTLYQVFFVLVFGLLLYACQTEDLILVKNSADFDNRDPATVDNRSKIPPWAKITNYQSPADGNFYAVGISNKHPFSGIERWSFEEASGEAISDAQRKVAQHIQVGLISLLSSSTQDTLTATQTEGGTVVQQKGRDELIMNVVASSDVVIRGLNSKENFWERYEKVGKDGAVREYYTYYVLASIPETEIAEERARLATMQDFEAEQKRNLDKRLQEYDSAKEILNQLDYRASEALYNGTYFRLRSIVTVIENMKFSDNDSELRDKQKKLLETAKIDIDRFDPQNQQRQIVRMLETKVADLNRQIDRLKNDHGGVVRDKEVEIQLKDEKIASLQGQLDITLRDLKMEINNLHSRGVTFVSQYTLFAYPPRPNERLVALDENSVYIASIPVSNREFSSFLTATNGNNVSTDSSALESSVVNVSWIQAAAYCNWLSRLYGYGEYYAIGGGTVRINGRGNGYRLPDRNEILAGLKNGVIEPESLITRGILGSGTDLGSMYAYRLLEESSGTEDIESLLGERILSGSEYDVETGFRVVRDAQR